MGEAFLNLPSEPIVNVITTTDRGLTVEEVAEQCLEKIISISDQAPSPIRDQAHAFKEHLRPLLINYMRQAVNNDRTTIYNVLRKAGMRMSLNILGDCDGNIASNVQLIQGRVTTRKA